MTVVVAVKCPDGIVLAADTRGTAGFTRSDGTSQKTYANFDSNHKLEAITTPNYKIAFGVAGAPIPPDKLPEIIRQMTRRSLSVFAFTKELAQQYSVNNKEGKATLLVAGYSKRDRIGKICVASRTSERDWSIQEFHGNQYGMVRMGDTLIGDRIINGYSKHLEGRLISALNLDSAQKETLRHALIAESNQCILDTSLLSLQECVDLSLLLVDATIKLQKLTVVERTVGGIVDIATITPAEVRVSKPLPVKVIARSLGVELVVRE